MIVVGVWTGLGIYLMTYGGLEMTASGLAFILIGFVWAWFVLWLPKAVVTSTELRVVNRLDFIAYHSRRSHPLSSELRS